MGNELILQFVALSFFTWWMGFCFCDGFQLHVVRKLVWFTIFAAIAIYVFRTTGEYRLELILPVPCLVALFLAWQEKKGKKRFRRG